MIFKTLLICTISMLLFTACTNEDLQLVQMKTKK